MSDKPLLDELFKEEYNRSRGLKTLRLFSKLQSMMEHIDVDQRFICLANIVSLVPDEWIEKYVHTKKPESMPKMKLSRIEKQIEKIKQNPGMYIYPDRKKWKFQLRNKNKKYNKVLNTFEEAQQYRDEYFAKLLEINNGSTNNSQQLDNGRLSERGEE
jgi:hypothetical protein